jgi:putative ABC transport system permease protein
MVNSDMGFDKEVVFNIRLQGYEFNKVKDVYSSIPEITKISGSSHVPGVGSSWDIKLKCNKADEENLTLNYFSIDSCYIETMGLKLVAGGNFPKDLSSKGQNIIINEKAVSKLRFSSATDAIGKSVWETHDSILVTVCGVVKDYKYVSLLRKSDALVLRNNPNDYRVATLRINSSNMVQTIDKLKAEWKKIDPIHEFQGQFVEEEIREYYSNFEDIIYTVGFTTILAIIIASLGLLGMATFSAQTRIKEVCIRKVYGADVKHIIYLVSKRYIWLLAISALIAVPLAFLINNLWLEFLAHHVDIGFFTIFLGVFIVLLIGLVTIASQTFKAANSNPADLLRYD